MDFVAGHPWLAACLVAIGLFCAAFLAAAETALTAASRSRLVAIAQSGQRRAAIALRLLEKKENLIGGLLIARVAINVANTAFVGWFFTVSQGADGAFYAILLMTLLIVLFGEIMPRMLAIVRPHFMAVVAARTASIVVAAMAPILGALQVLSRRLLRLFGVRIKRSQPVLSAHEELTGAVDLLSRESGAVKSDREMIGGLLDLKDLMVSDVMVHRTEMRTIDADQPTEAIVREALASPYTRMPLWRDSPENIVGLIHAKDLLRALTAAGGDPSRVDLTPIAIPPWFTPQTTALPDQLRAFLQKKSHFAFAIDEYGVVMGLVTLEDVLEEIVGDIKDEHDVGPTVRPQRDGSVIAEGSAPIRDVNRAMNWRLPDDGATTIAGLVINEARMIPETRQAFTFHGFRFDVLRKQRNRIAALRIAPVQKEDAADEKHAPQ